jgi:hypothetical protein
VLDDPANQPVLSALQGGGVPNLDDSSFLSTVDPVLARPILEGFASSMSTVFLTAAAVLVVGLFAVLRMKEVPLRTQSGVEAQRGLTPEASAVAQAATATTVAPPVAPAAAPVTAAAPATSAEGGAMRPVTDGPRPWPRSGPTGGDGARTIVPRGANGVGSLGNGQPGDTQLGNGWSGNGQSGNGHGVPTGIANGTAAAVLPADPRDRLLAMLLPDPPQALTLIAAAEQARDAARRARRMLADHTRDLDRARAELAAQGLSPAQVGRLLELTVEESPEHGGRHREARAPAPPSAN